MPGITIRIASKSDAELIADLSRETFYESFAAFNTTGNMEKFMNESFSREKLIAEVESPGNIFLLAFPAHELSNSNALGYARLRENNNPEQLQGQQSLEIARIYAVTNAIGKGVGRALMQKSIDIAKGKNKEVIWLGVWEKN